VSETSEHPVDDLAAHALGALTVPERAEIDAHVATCPTCVARLQGYEAVAGSLPLALDPAMPPPATWAGIRAALPGPGRRAGRARTVVRRGWRRAASWPALAALAASLLIWNVLLHRELARHASGPQVEALARRPGRLIILGGRAAPGASAPATGRPAQRRQCERRSLRASRPSTIAIEDAETRAVAANSSGA
jgi:anti-sigma factor RsiW